MNKKNNLMKYLAAFASNDEKMRKKEKNKKLREEYLKELDKEKVEEIIVAKGLNTFKRINSIYGEMERDTIYSDGIYVCKRDNGIYGYDEKMCFYFKSYVKEGKAFVRMCLHPNVKIDRDEEGYITRADFEEKYFDISLELKGKIRSISEIKSNVLNILKNNLDSYYYDRIIDKKAREFAKERDSQELVKKIKKYFDNTRYNEVDEEIKTFKEKMVNSCR